MREGEGPGGLISLRTPHVPSEYRSHREDTHTQTGALRVLSRSGVAAAALLMPAGFFFSSMGAGRTKPNKLVWLVIAGAALLAVSLVPLGIGLLTA